MSLGFGGKSDCPCAGSSTGAEDGADNSSVGAERMGRGWYIAEPLPLICSLAALPVDF